MTPEKETRGPAPDAHEERRKTDEPAPAERNERDERVEQGEQDEQDEGQRPQDAWSAARELRDYAPDDGPAFGGGYVAGSQYGVAGGTVHGGVTFNFGMGGGTGDTGGGSGEIPAERLDALARVFREPPRFGEALRALTDARVVVLRGGHDTGRRAAAWMLLRRAGATRPRALDPATGPAVLHRPPEKADGYVVCDLRATRGSPLTEHHLLRCREWLSSRGAHLVITVESRAAVTGDVPVVDWEPPAPSEVMTGHLLDALGGDQEAVARLLRFDAVRDFLATSRPVRQIAEFAAMAARCHRGEVSAEALARFGEEAALRRVGDWLSATGETSLREKAFLLSLAVFDAGPYPVVAELGDALYRRLRRVESPEQDPGLPVFGDSIGERLARAQAVDYSETEQTPWGPVRQRMVRFEDDRTARLLLREAWTGHPAVRAPMHAWLTDLARHGNPFVRVRAAYTVARLAEVDLSSVMHDLLRAWASSKDYRLCLQAANALTTAAVLGVPGAVRVLEEWSRDGHPRRRWTAVRAWALAGPVFPAEALDTLAGLARDDAEAGGADDPELTEAVELLLLEAHIPQVLGRLAEWVGDGPPVLRDLAAGALAAAASRWEEEREGRPGGWPLLLRHWDAAGPGTREHASALWRRVLGNRDTTQTAQARLADWVRAAADDPALETALARLLACLVDAETDRLRLAHLLRTMPDADGGPPPPVARRLLRALAPDGRAG
ncbi:hypothetical protein [Streptomyces sp. 7-21]|uniref:hypothetical protein n=1 Tax=Streptomyces sp. 7-21 TaxID=2802283 RepID=UPI00191F1CB0|nr:hypothetical protein [Streptomyces sp. 7-21]MBL1067747.1 hypothetical protein [Streptomyces sp. 7-21]